LSPDLRLLLRDASNTWPSRYPVVLVMLIPVCAFFAMRGVHRGFVTGAGLLFAGAVVWSLTRGAWVGIAVMGLMFVVCRLRGWKAALLTASMIAVVSARMPSVQARFWLAVPQNGTFESSAALRFAIWRDAATAVMRSPVFGYGEQGTGVVLGTVESELDVVSGAAAHSDYVDVAMRKGLPGLVLYLGIVGAVIAFGLRLSLRPEGERWPAYIVVGLAGAFAYGFFHELLRHPVAASAVWFLLGILGHQQAIWRWNRASTRSVPPV
jgi:O-antigen ligase